MYLRMLCKHTTKMKNLFAVYSRIICVNTTTITIASLFNDQVYENVIAPIFMYLSSAIYL